MNLRKNALSRARLAALFWGLLFGPLLAGCIVIPLPSSTIQGNSPAGKVGSAGSWFRPLKVSEATRREVAVVLGPPDYVAQDGALWSYTWRTRGGWVFVFASEIDGMRVVREHVLTLRFDDNDVLVGFTRRRRGGYGPGVAAHDVFNAGNFRLPGGARPYGQVDTQGSARTHPTE